MGNHTLTSATYKKYKSGITTELLPALFASRLSNKDAFK
jgi:hypothetical protein